MSWYIPVPKDNVNVVAGWGSYQLKGNGVPNDASGKLGDTYLNVADNRMYFKRWVGNFSGIDTVVGPAILGVVQNQEFSMDCMFKADPAITTFKFVVSNNANQTSGMVNVGVNSPVTKFGSDHYGIGGQFVSGVSIDSWHSLKYTGIHNGTSWIETVTVDGISQSGSTSGGFVAGTTTRLGGLEIRQWLGKICNVRLVGNGKILNWKIDEGSGTFISDASGNGNNGTLTDSSPTTFWSQSWVPMDLI